MNEKIKRLARFGLLTALAVILGYVESLLPIAPGLPGVKLGLGNTVIVYALYLMDNKSAAALLLCKVLLCALLFSGASALLYSFAGGVLSLGAMMGLKRWGVGLPALSVGGAVAHNLGQLLIACLVLQSRAVLTYLPVLLLAGLLTGLLSGWIARLVIKAMQKNGGI